MTVRDFMVNIGVKVDEDSVKTAESTMNNLKGTISKALKVIGISFSLTSINSLLEEWNDVNKVLNRVNTDLEDSFALQDKILESANACRMAYSDMADYVNDLVRNGSNFFSTAEDAADFLTTANQLFYVSGATESEISSLNKAITNTFTKGKMSASDFNTMMSACPEAVTILADSLGITEQQVKALGTAGNITAKQLKSALTGAADEIESAYGDTAWTISEAIQMIKNEWGTWLSQMDQTYELTDSIAHALVSAFEWVLNLLQNLVAIWDRIVDMFGSTQTALTVIIGLAGTLFAVFKFDKIKSGISSITKAFNGFGGKIMMVVAVILILILVIQDLMAFVNGEDSVTGDIFDKLGMDADSFRETLSTLFDAIGQVVSALSQALGPILESLGGVLQSIINIVVQLVNIFTGILTSTINESAGNIQNLVEIVEDLFSALDGLIQFISGIFMGDMEEAGNGLMKLGYFVIDALLSMLESAVNNFVKMFNKIVDFFDMIAGWFGGSIEWRMSEVSIPRPPEPEYFAEGGYVPANSPRMAVVGDNEQEGEYIAPESMLRQAVQEAMSAQIIAGIMAMNANGGARAMTANGMAAVTDNSVTRIYQSIYMENTFNQDGLDVQRETSQAMGTSADELVRTLANAVKYS